MTRITSKHKHYVRTFIEERSGHVTAEALLREAQRPESPLHDLFDWDVKRAARIHWLDRCREILRTITVPVETETQVYQAPYVVRDPDKKTAEQGYVSLPTLQDDEALARRAIRQEIVRAEEVVQRIRGLAAALSLTAEVEDLLERLVQLKAAVEHHRVKFSPATAMEAHA